jgi:dethiobiotin synthetase
MSAVFVTATGTEIGKTAVASALIRTARRRGIAVDALKPVVSGFDPDAPESSDPARLLDALGEPLTAEALDHVCPWRFRAPLAPNMAARLEDRSVPFRHIVALGQRRMPTDPAGLLVIEGAGGVMSPLSDETTNLDLISALQIPALLVAGSYLGAISHTLTALDALRTRDVQVPAVVVSESEGATVGLTETVAELARFASPVPVIPVPRVSEPETWDATALVRLLLPT